MHLPACQFGTIAVNINGIWLTALSPGEAGTEKVVGWLAVHFQVLDDHLKH